MFYFGHGSDARCLLFKDLPVKWEVAILSILLPLPSGMTMDVHPTHGSMLHCKVVQLWEMITCLTFNSLMSTGFLSPQLTAVDLRNTWLSPSQRYYIIGHLLTERINKYPKVLTCISTDSAPQAPLLIILIGLPWPTSRLRHRDSTLWGHQRLQQSSPLVITQYSDSNVIVLQFQELY